MPGKNIVNSGTGLTDETRRKVVDLLNHLLADEFVLYTKTRNFHWNVVGLHFGPLHALFESQYEALDDIVDAVAERARALDGRAAGSLAEFLRLTRLQESSAVLSETQMIAALLADHEAIVRVLRGAANFAGEAGDAGTEDFLVGLIENHAKTAWMLRAHSPQ